MSSDSKFFEWAEKIFIGCLLAFIAIATAGLFFQLIQAIKADTAEPNYNVISMRNSMIAECLYKTRNYTSTLNGNVAVCEGILQRIEFMETTVPEDVLGARIEYFKECTDALKDLNEPPAVDAMTRCDEILLHATSEKKHSFKLPSAH